LYQLTWDKTFKWLKHSQILVIKVWQYIKSCHTFGQNAVKACIMTTILFKLYTYIPPAMRNFGTKSTFQSRGLPNLSGVSSFLENLLNNFRTKTNKGFKKQFQQVFRCNKENK
jgi:hypothetical protein